MPGELPQTTGREVAGVVDEIGEGVTDAESGDRVFGFAAGGGGAAELALLENYAPIPPSLDFAGAAALPVAVETATRALDLLGVGDGTTVLINGAAGGVGSAAVQIARNRGARVIGTASAANHEYLRSLGAEPTTYGDGLVARVRALAPDGVDAALDAHGGGALPALVELAGDARAGGNDRRLPGRAGDRRATSAAGRAPRARCTRLRDDRRSRSRRAGSRCRSSRLTRSSRSPMRTVTARPGTCAASSCCSSDERAARRGSTSPTRPSGGGALGFAVDPRRSGDARRGHDPARRQRARGSPAGR